MSNPQRPPASRVRTRLGVPKRRESSSLPVTSSWYAKLPPEFARIGISRYGPRGQRGFRTYRPLAPGEWFKTASALEFRALYMEQLSKLDPGQVLRGLEALAEGRTPALLCHEKPPPDTRWCHRALVSAWLADALGIAVTEYGHEAEGTGWSHPKLPAAWRQDSNTA